MGGIRVPFTSTTLATYIISRAGAKGEELMGSQSQPTQRLSKGHARPSHQQSHPIATTQSHRKLRNNRNQTGRRRATARGASRRRPTARRGEREGKGGGGGPPRRGAAPGGGHHAVPGTDTTRLTREVTSDGHHGNASRVDSPDCAPTRVPRRDESDSGRTRDGACPTGEGGNREGMGPRPA